MTDRRSIAIHEAGHAVVTFFEGRSVRRVTVKPRDSAVGHVAFPRRRPDWHPTTGTALSYMVGALAGYWAQRLFGYRPNLFHWQSDRESAADYALSVAGEGEADLWLRIANMRAKRLVSIRRAEIEIVADRLMEVDTIDMAELRRLVLSRGPISSYIPSPSSAESGE